MINNNGLTTVNPPSPVLLHLHRLTKLIIVFTPRNSHLLVFQKWNSYLLDQRFSPVKNEIIK